MGGIKNPNIWVKFGNQDQADYEKETTIYYSEPDLTDELEKFRIDMSEKGCIRKRFVMGYAIG